MAALSTALVHKKRIGDKKIKDPVENVSNGWGSEHAGCYNNNNIMCMYVYRGIKLMVFSKQLKTVRQEHGQMAFERKSFFSIHLNITILIKANKKMSRR